MIKGTNKLETVKQAFRHWRATRTKRSQIPDELWEQVKGLLGDYTLSKIGSPECVRENETISWKNFLRNYRAIETFICPELFCIPITCGGLI